MSAHKKTLLARTGKLLAKAKRLLRRERADAEPPTTEPEAAYHAGLALARQGKFAHCLRLWQSLPAGHPDFLAQKKAVASLLIQELARQLEAAPLAMAAAVRQELADLAARGLNLAELAGGKELLARCRSLQMAQCWQEGRLREIMTLAEEIDALHPTLLEIEAKAAYQLLSAADAAVSAAELRQFIDSWLSALFHPAVMRPAPPRQTLLQLGAALVRRQAIQLPESGGRLLRHWEEDLALLNSIAAASSRPEAVLCTPALALRTGQSKAMLSLIAASENGFADRQEWLNAGAAYSAAAAALLLLRQDEQERAISETAQLESGCADPFAVHAVARIRLECGKHYLSCGRNKEAESALTSLVPQAGTSAELAEQLLALLDREDEHDPDRLAVSINLLTLLEQESSSDRVRKALAAALTNQVVLLRNEQQAHLKPLLADMEKAVALNPDDEFARLTLADLKAELEITAMQAAVNRGDLSQAARIAAETCYPHVKEQFFDFARQIAAQVEQGDYPDSETAVFMLSQLLKNVLKVDRSHNLLHHVRQLLGRLQAEPEA